MIDIQSQSDNRGLALPDVGITGLRHRVLTGDGRDQSHVVANIEVGVAVGTTQRGTHMSRLVQLIQEHEGDLTVERLPVVMKRLLASLEAESGQLAVRFPLVVDAPSPVTGLRAQNVHDARLEIRQTSDDLEIEVSVEVVTTSLCPCSKAISDYGAHNQRSRISASVVMNGASAVPRLPSLRDLVAWAEGASSCPVYPLLKRADERAVTMRAFEHPAFVEDMARDLALELRSLPGPGRYAVRVLNEESIHRHDAYAKVGGDLGQVE